MNSVTGAAVKLGIFVAIVAVCAAFIVAALNTPVPQDKVSYDAVFTDVSGLYTGDVVRMSGVAVGKVDRVELDGTNARVRFTVDRQRPLYDNTEAAVRYQDLIGQRYVELMTARPGGVPLAAGATIPVERTIPSFDVSKLFNGFKPLFETLDTAQLNQFGTNILRVLQGDGSGIGPVLADLDRLTQHAKSSEAVIVLLINNLGEISRSIGGKSAAVGDLVKQLDGILSQFGGRTSMIIKAIEQSNRTLAPLIPLLEELQGAYDESYLPLDGLLRRVLPQTDQIVEILSLVPSLISGLNRNIPAGGEAKTYTCAGGELGLPGIGEIVLGNQRLVVCK
ncbi:phospholipid/cholesterol/gamma-HCH transport system substrate-binding protein [Nocardia tenerifensis]|uniref:Phospholipid/cholesterol/gamma-HCH transport system substrate-binding protein n=1 Tax=Nocardia tenerifensis TaxID=228006 RepID=A0A318JSC4_9NOCA|nr:MlaD family protein [Nocardia tenerifensis]PXX53310.1 phospholipid/cholesterol/gamma-HCH transport system substrate-binding protein [Nocardia tenerifensis]